APPAEGSRKEAPPAEVYNGPGIEDKGLGGQLSAPVRLNHATVPNSVPTPAVTAIASAPQNVTRIAPTSTPAPPARAASAPRSVRNTNDVPATRGISAGLGAMAATKRG